MSRVTYYMGAGASAGKRSSNGLIIEGLPCVNEITNRMGSLISSIERAKFHEGERDWSAPYAYLNSLEDWEKAKLRLLSSLQVLYEACQRNATIDTYAKKLVLQEKKAELEQLERLLTMYFILEQVLNNPDTRYDTFLANILQDRRQFPENIKVLSWNYDSQFKIAYDEYDQKNKLNIGSKLSTEYKQFDILKLNGSATFRQSETIPEYVRTLKKIMKEAKRTDFYGDVDEVFESILPEIVLLYHLFVGEVNPTRENTTNLSFAFDYTRSSDIMLRRAKEIVAATDVLVVIGYTFPFFNREIDRRILEPLNPDARIYIQDLFPGRIRQSLQAVCPNMEDSKIHLLTEVDQFFLPPQL